MSSHNLSEQTLENAREKAFWENHVIAIFNLILSLTALIPALVMGCVMLYWREVSR